MAKSSLKIIVLRTDAPSMEVITGGQKRAKAIADYYTWLNYKVCKVGIYAADYNGPSGRGDYDITVSKGFKNYVLVADAILSDAQAYKALAHTIRSFRPDAVQIEGPFLFPVIEHLRKDGVLPESIKLIYSSHNIEYKLLRDMPEANERTGSLSLVEYLKGIEQKTINSANVIIVCTKKDAEETQRMGGKNIIVASNGIAPIKYRTKEVKGLKKEYAANGFHKTIAYISSGHPPNVKGFLDIVGTRLGFLGFDTRIVLAGGVSSAVADYIEKKRDIVEKACFYQRYGGYGIVSEEKLSAIIKLANVIILPITNGGGSNLKTAEALQSRKPIVATSMAMRDYERFINFPNIFIEDNPEKFQQKMAKLVNHPPKCKFTKEQSKMIDSVLWQSTLMELSRMGELL